MPPVPHNCDCTISEFPAGVTGIQVNSDYSSTYFYSAGTQQVSYFRVLQAIKVYCPEGTVLPNMELLGAVRTQSEHSTYDSENGSYDYGYLGELTITGDFTISFVPAISDLTGTKWVLNSSLTRPAGESAVVYSVNFTCSTNDFHTLGFPPSAFSNSMYYSNNASTPTVYNFDGSWTNQAYRLIEITGGTDAQNSTLISWLLANATQVPVVDLSGTEWEFAGNSVSFANISYIGTYSINYGIICNDTTYDANDGTALNFGYTSEYNPHPRVDKVQQIAYITINTSNYRDFGGAFYQSNGRIFESSYADTLTYPVTLHNTSGSSPTYVEKISITDGDDVQNPDFIVWLTNNATIQESSSPEITIGTLSLASVYCNGNITKIILNGVTLYEKIYYPITVTLTNATASQSNPSVIAEDGTTTLVFTFDGTNYICPTTSPVVTGATGVWTKNSDSQGTMVLSNANGNVSFSVAGEQALPQLDTPINLSVTDTTASFDEVENAEKYEFFVDDVSIGEYPTVTLISFSISSATYQAEQGMTWQQWVDSEYNTDGYYISDNKIFAAGANFYISRNTSTVELPTNVIQENYGYGLGGGASND